MYLKVCRWRIIRAIALFFSFFSVATASNAVDFNLTEVADGVFVHQGKHLMMTDPGGDDIANIGFIVGESCIAVIDTGGSTEVGQRLLKSITRTSSKPICYVINTHVHLDHILGNAAFNSQSIRFVGHHKLASAITANQQYFHDHPDAPGTPSNLPELIAPSVVVDEFLKIDLGKRELLLQANPTAHTDQDLTVYDAKTDTLWLSDLLVLERAPRLYGSLNGWIEIISNLEEKQYHRVIPGHGPVSAAWPVAAKPLKNYLTVLRDDVRAAIIKGKFLKETMESAAQNEKNNWVLFEQNNPHNVSRAFAELEWE